MAVERIGTAAKSVGAVVLVDTTFAELHYKGNPEINNGLHFCDMLIDKMD